MVGGMDVICDSCSVSPGAVPLPSSVGDDHNAGQFRGQQIPPERATNQTTVY